MQFAHAGNSETTLDNFPMPSPRHEAALAYARAGIPIFICKPNGKHPATPNSFKDATTDEQIINGWFAIDDFNIAFEPAAAGMTVIDADGEDDRDWPETYTVQTPRGPGGKHRYYLGTVPPSGARKLGPHTDVKSVRGYVLLPGSVVDGNFYKVVDNRPVQPLPAGIAAELAKRDEAVLRPDVELDQPHNVERARTMVRDWIARGRVAISGAGGNSLTYQCACELRDLGLSQMEVIRRLQMAWNDACVPPWSNFELSDIVEHAYRYAENSPGAWANPDPAEAFAEVAANVRDSSPKSPYYFAAECEMDREQPMEWLFEDVWPKIGTGLLLGAPDSYKSFLALHWALRVGTGEGAAFYGAGEGLHRIRGSRRLAWKALNGVAEVPNFYAGRTAIVSDMAAATDFADQIASRRELGAVPRLIVLDTVFRCMLGLKENAPEDMGKMVAFADTLSREFQCFVLMLHHTPKAGGMDGRGSGVLEAGVDTSWYVDPDHRTKTAKLICTRQKDADRGRNLYFVMRPMLDSLAPQQISEDEWAILTAGATPYSGPMIAAALRELGADVSNPASTTVLAEHLCHGRPKAGETLEAYYQRVEWTEKQLAGLFRSGKLSGYGKLQGRTILWFLPQSSP